MHLLKRSEITLRLGAVVVDLYNLDVTLCADLLIEEPEPVIVFLKFADGFRVEYKLEDHPEKEPDRQRSDDVNDC